MGKYCICATVDTGLIEKVVTLATARNNVPMGWIILRGTITADRDEAENHLRNWKRSPRRLMRQLESRIMY